MSLLSNLLTLTPNLEVEGETQRFVFNKKNKTGTKANLVAHNDLVPFDDVAVYASVGSENCKLSGYKWSQRTKVGQKTGDYVLQAFTPDNVPVDLLEYSEEKKIFNFLADITINGKEISGGASSGSSLTAEQVQEIFDRKLNGLTLDKIGKAVSLLDLNRQKLTNLSDGTNTLDAVNKGQLDNVAASITNGDSATLRSANSSMNTYVTNSLRNLTFQASQIANYPTDSTKYLNGAGQWTSITSQGQQKQRFFASYKATFSTNKTLKTGDTVPFDTRTDGFGPFDSNDILKLARNDPQTGIFTLNADSSATRFKIMTTIQAGLITAKNYPGNVPPNVGLRWEILTPSGSVEQVGNDAFNIYNGTTSASFNFYTNNDIKTIKLRVVQVFDPAATIILKEFSCVFEEF